MAGWDEDPLTMAAEAARVLIADSPPEALRFASTSAYFTDRGQAGAMLDILALPRHIRTSDAANSRRAGTSALLEALLGQREEVIAAAEKRETVPGNSANLSFGDGAAAVRTGVGKGAQLLGHATITHDLVDRYSSREHPASYSYEERFIREVAIAELLLPAITAALDNAGIAAGDIAQAAVAEPAGGCWAAVSRKLGIAASNHCATLEEQAGDLGVAHPLYALGMALTAAAIGEHVLLVGFGSGVDALVFRKDGEIPGAAEMAEALSQGERLERITRFLSLTGGIEMDWGMRAEFAQKAQATVLERVGRDMAGFVGGRDSLGNVQFPKSSIPVNPALNRPEELVDVRLAEENGTIVSLTSDRLNFTPDPPFDFGLVQFANGARVLMEMVDRPPEGFTIGQEVCMRPRIKSLNRALGFRTYFWKAAPVARPQLGDA
ncbi:hypothetical protein [Altererythrobacter sp. BO-6]|uniref:hypothetical protein n=1 Tax=Altererythrobacter sp. BO-6 TaxID=2604537 RepID=UPI0019D021B6|nr:hypothetical protein [Altererythrobacter sp. BO-6]